MALTPADLQQRVNSIEESCADTNDSITIDLSAFNDVYTSDDTMTYSSPDYTTVAGGGYTIGSGLSWPSTNITIGGSTGSNAWSNGLWTTSADTNINAQAKITANGKMELRGEGADLIINGVSLLEVLQERLNLLVPNPELEKEWDELKELGDKYRELEAECKEKADVWQKLKAMPPPPLS